MIHSKKVMLALFIIPFAALLALTAYKKTILSVGSEFTFAIDGYDPRDLLSGHYLIYRILYEDESACLVGGAESREGYMCVTQPAFSYDEPALCTRYIKGICNHGRFEAGIEKFYVPQEHALRLEKEIRSKSASIKVSVTHTGEALVKDLLIDGVSWREVIAKPETP